MNSDPWILVSNFHQDNLLEVEKNKEQTAILMRVIYSKRMQIEQNFRDDKSERLGFGWRFSRTRDKNKMSMLILLATIASLILWMIGYAAERQQLHYAFQANTVRSHRVLSLLYLAKQLILNGLKGLRIRKFVRIITFFQLEFNENSLFNQWAKGELKK